MPLTNPKPSPGETKGAERRLNGLKNERVAMSEKSLVTIGDFVDFYYKVRQKGYLNLMGRFGFSRGNRVRAKWNNVEGESDFWSIPKVHNRWNSKCTGNPDMGYEEYTLQKYFEEKRGLHLLSVGCGTGSREQKYARHPAFSRIVGIDLADNQIAEARENARNLKNINYLVGDFQTALFDKESFDVILFNSSLHHFARIENLVQKKIKPLLKTNGLLIIFEYAGPSRLQWTNHQLREANRLLRELPEAFRMRRDLTGIKNTIYRPGLIRMQLNDPSEAVDSSSILPALHQHFEVVEEHQIGTDLIHIVLKDIAHNFTRQLPDTDLWLEWLFDAEDQYLAATGKSDMVFGVYRKKALLKRGIES